ncbi:hypothetical protein BN2497_8533 [Janthinobacterium sp. CG23_2]|nr:hypothetical protein BN2497_8533 [Janthinobacterium sp. CG23_2]CUU30664.1 hypothetical protein BN3177_8533 [Janthinobacterium sp. CG23_2]
MTNFATKARVASLDQQDQAVAYFYKLSRGQLLRMNMQAPADLFC